MTNKLSIKKEFWHEVTEMPHFIVKVAYEGCALAHDDIYFENINEVISGLETMERERERKGKVILDGGFRFIASIEIMATGGIELNFQIASAEPFPGELNLRGYFSVSGEYTSSLLNSMIQLFRNGKEIII